MEQTIHNKKMLVYGYGQAGIKFYEKNKERYNIIGFIDSFKKSNEVKIYTPKEAAKFLGEANVVIVSTRYMLEMINTMTSLGFILFENLFLPWMFSNKKLAMVFGNCQTDMIKRFLMLNKNFSEIYDIVDTPMIHTKDCEACLREFKKSKIMDLIDLLIIQNVSDDNQYGKYLASKNIISMVNEKCQVVRIPIMHFTGYFPQRSGSLYLKTVANVDNPMGSFSRDINIETMVNNGFSNEEILKEIKDISFYSDKQIQDNILYSLSLLKHHEINTDITISDFIENNYRKEVLFYSINHPNNRVIKEFCNRIFKVINFKPLENNECLGVDLKSECELIYPSVEKYIFNKSLNITYKIGRISPEMEKKVNVNKEYNFDEYVKLLLYVCYNKNKMN